MASSASHGTAAAGASTTTTTPPPQSPLAQTQPAPQPPPSPSERDVGGAPTPHSPHTPHTPTSVPSRSPKQHRRASSLSSPETTTPKVVVVPPGTLSARASQVQPLSDEELRALRAESGAKREAKHEHEQQEQERIMVTPPENLPPSPPLTSLGSEGDVDVDVDADADADTEPMVVEAPRAREEDVADALRPRRAAAAGKASLEVVERHPLASVATADDFGGLSGDAGADVDLEKGRDAPEPPAPPSTAEVDLTEVGMTKPFEVMRKPKRTASPKPPHSSYYVGPPTGTTAYYTAPRGVIGVHHPREIVRVERDYDHGELVQFSSSYPLELQGRITPTQFLETINALNEGLIHAHSVSGAFMYNTLAVLTLWLSPILLESRYDREMKKLQRLVDAFNAELYNPQGLNILWPRKSAFLFLEIEYY